MELISSEFSAGFYVLSLLVTGGLFFLFRRLFRRVFAAESTVVVATVLAAVVSSLPVLLALSWLVLWVRTHL